MAENWTQFDRLPLEMMCELFTYLSRNDIQMFRFISKRSNSAILSSNMCLFRSNTLSDETSKLVLTSEVHVKEIIVENLKTQIAISSTRGLIIAEATSLIFRGSIHTTNLKKILQACNNLQSLGFDATAGCTSIEACFQCKISFEFVSSFTLTARLQDGVTTQDEMFFRKLAKSKRFPCLKHFNVDWIHMHLTANQNLISLDLKSGVYLFSIYVSIHQILWNHRDTIVSISWDLSGFRLASPTNLPENYNNLKLHIGDIILQDISITSFPNEGQVGFDLSGTLLNAQAELRRLTLIHTMILTHAVDNVLFLPIAIPMENNRLTLEEFSIKTDMFPFAFLAGFSSLKILRICTRLLLITEAVILKQITHLYLNVEINSVQSDFGYDRMNWIYDNMNELVELEMLYCTLYSAPTARTFLKFFKPPKMKRLSFKFNVWTAANRDFIQGRFDQVIQLCGSTPGVTISWSGTPETLGNFGFYELICLVDRRVFNGFVRHVNIP